MDSYEIKLSVDAKNLSCPMPIIRIKKAIATVDVGDVIEAWATDPGALSDVRAWTRSVGHELLTADEDEGPTFRFLIRRSR